MTDPSEWTDETQYDDLEAASLVDETLPSDHRSGFVAVVGRPNVGKSTLMNHLLGQKIAIVSHKPQTTRNQLLGILTIPVEAPPPPLEDMPPAQIIFVDTPGIHQPRHKLGEYLVDAAHEALIDADVIIWLVDVTTAPTPEDELVARALQDVQQAVRQKKEPAIPVLLALNKVDSLPPAEMDGAEEPFLALYQADQWLLISAAYGDNQKQMLRWIIDQLPPGPRYFPEDQVTDQHTRFIAGELIREAALKILHQEVPHALAVQVLEFKPRHENLTYISANLILERQSQKKIVIGEGGKTLKKIGQTARLEIEELLDTQVYLELWVKVRPKWRKKETDLRWLGYST